MGSNYKILSDGFECVPYISDDFPVYAGGREMNIFGDIDPHSHWHDDFEFHYARKGHILYIVNGVHVTLESGQGLFINSRQSHGLLSVDISGSEYICVLIHPSMLAASKLIKESYIAPLASDGARPHIVLEPGVPWQAAIIQNIVTIYDMFKSPKPGAELYIMSVAYQLFDRLLTNAAPKSAPVSRDDDIMPVIRKIDAYIRKHMAEPILAGDIASAGDISAYACYKLLKEYLDMTPIEYLNRVRLEKSMELLSNTKASVSEIALMTGFASRSYFTKCFRGKFGVTPTEYRGGAEISV